MHGSTQTDSKISLFPRRIGPTAGIGDADTARDTREPVVRAASLKAAIAQLRDLTKANANRSSQEALAANLVLLRAHGVEDEVLDLVVEMVLAQNVDEEMTAAVNYLASGFLLALLTLKEADCTEFDQRSQNHDAPHAWPGAGHRMPPTAHRQSRRRR
jgi:hypothetical protein